jgi:hypothetical protein
MAASSDNYSKLYVNKGITVKTIGHEDVDWFFGSELGCKIQEHGDETLGSIKDGEFFDKLNDSEVLLHGTSYIIINKENT